MLEQLIDIDQQIIVLINSWHAPWADNLMWIVSGKLTWVPLYLLLVALLWWRLGWKNTLFLLIGFAVAVGCADYISSGIIKHLVCRPRPTHEPAIMDTLHIVNGYRGGMYGFVSSHAANTMAVALLFCLIYNNLLVRLRPPKYKTRNALVWTFLMLWVAANCYSRMYLGVHYLGDILGGLAVGALSATAVYFACRRLGLLSPCGCGIGPTGDEPARGE